MIKEIHTSFFSSKNTYISPNVTHTDLDIIDALKDLLPHGSGINSNWYFQLGNRGIIRAYNTFDAMNETGMYCHYYDFIAYLRQVEPGKFELLNLCILGREYKCCGYGLVDYLSDTIACCLDN